MPVAVMVVGLAVLALTVVFAPSYDRYAEPGVSMEPTIPAESSVTGLEISGDEVRRGDIVVFPVDVWADSRGSSEKLVRRVVAVGGDTVASDDVGRVSVNGKPISEDYTAADPMARAFSVQVDRGKVFVMGDNRGNSRDSRLYVTLPERGGIPASAITAVVVKVDGKPLSATTAFTAAGLDGAPTADKSDWSTPALAGGALVFLGGAAWLVFGLSRRKRTVVQA
ncbi:signal peptidase I [Actinokineospora globicatena]|uniref:Signal peptidase I n=1 Tax=Actinokineospora globicatena TaxID=103729 RepID=A0A9W6VAF4_9PSEU|nr:signal peptidase I [Actinokineospora globicatena]GLW91923.1 signal peptidase I [Actinokineospora globicatena]